MTVLTGTGTLIRFILRRDRVRIPVWILAITVSVVGSVATLPQTYPTRADRQARAELMSNPATVMLTGPGHGVEDYTYGAMTANELLLWAALAVALMSLLLFARHTRAEEESGRAELVRATVVGRHAATTAALIVVGGANLLLGAILALGLAGALDELSMTGSLVFGASTAAVGLVFAGVAAVAAQVPQHARGVTGIGGAVLGLAIVLRGAGDAGDGTLSWLSPIGWAQATRAYVDERWWPLLPALALTVLLIAVALPLSTRRDVGAGLLPPRPGPSGASAVLARPVGLALRLQRGLLIGWSAGTLLFGMGIGSIADQAGEFFAENQLYQDYIAALGQAAVADITDTILSTYMFFLAVTVSIYALQAVLQLRSEETAGRAEPVLATPVSRRRWVGAMLAATLAGSVVVLAVGGLGAGLSHAAATGDAGQIPRLVAATLVHAPAVWLLVGLAIAVFGLAPRAIALVWAILAALLFVTTLGPFLQLPDWAYDLSPFGHTPQLPAAGFTIGPLLALTAIAAALTAIGLAAFRRRDINVT